MSDSTLTIREEPSVALMLQGIIDKGITAESVAVMGQLVALKERMDAKQAEKDFVADFVSLKQAMPKIQATKGVPGKDGNIKYHFAPLDEIDNQLNPVALKHGFTYSFTEEASTRVGTITKVCIVQHKSGHSARHPFSVRIGNGPPGSTDSQADGAAHSYAKRGALCDAFGIVISHDDDARALGGSITQAQADQLRRMVKETKSDEAAFLTFAGADTFEAIDSSQLDRLVEKLEKKMAKAPSAPAPERKLDPKNAKGEFEWEGK